MKNLFGKKESSTPNAENLNTETKAEVSAESLSKQTGVPLMDNPPAPPKEWKAFKANSLSDATGFMNERGIDPEFIFAGSNGQINIFYKG